MQNTIGDVALKDFSREASYRFHGFLQDLKLKFFAFSQPRVRS